MNLQSTNQIQQQLSFQQVPYAPSVDCMGEANPQKHPVQPALDTAEELAKVKEQAANLGREVRATISGAM